MSTLSIIVDAQTGYLRYLFAQRRAIGAEVRSNAEKGIPALALEMFEKGYPPVGTIPDEHKLPDGTYWEAGRSISEVRDVEKDYPHLFHYVLKRKRNGGPEVLEHCARLGISPRTFRMCGGYLDGCLYTTALSLLCTVPDCTVEIAGPATYINDKLAWLYYLDLHESPQLVRIRSTPSVLPVLKELLQFMTTPWGSLDELRRLTPLLTGHPDKPVESTFQPSPYRRF